VPISDINKAIFWLSIVNSGRDFLGTGGTFYSQNVDKVAAMIGGEPRRIWEAITMRGQIPKPPKRMWLRVLAVILAVGSMIASFGIVLYLTNQRLLALGSVLAILIVLAMAVSRKDGLKTGRLLSENPKIVELAGNLLQELISWTSENTDHPIRIVVMQETSGAKTVDSLENYLIAEIRPKSTTTQPFMEPVLPRKEEKPTEKQVESGIRKQKAIFASAHLIAALIAGFLVFLAIRLIMNGRASPLDFIFFGVVVLFFAFIQYAVYSLLPFTKMMFRGYKMSPSDLEMILKRTPKKWLEREYYQNVGFKQKIDLMQMFTTQKSVELSSLHELIKPWLQEDAKQPEKFRYFKIEEGNVTLTPKGEMLAETVRKKGSNIDKLLRKMEDLNQRMRSYRGV